MIKNNNNYQFINNNTELEKIANIIISEKDIAVDLEADSMFHFKEKICLIQIATNNNTIVIDTLNLDALSSLKPIFENKKIQKILHGSDYDIRSLYRDFHIEVNNLFDTELACRFLGIKHSGLEPVLKKRFNIKLDKKYQKKDWSQRPLPEGMMEYGAKDVIYLLKLAKILEKELEEKLRLSWVKEECELLSKVRANSFNHKPHFLKIKGAGRLDPRSLAVLEELLELRIILAEKKDKPLFKIFSNNSLIKLSKKKPAIISNLKKLNILSPKQISMFGNEIIESINKGLQIPDSRLPVYPKKSAPILEATVPNRIKLIKEWRDHKAEKLELDPSLLLNKNLLTALAIKKPKKKSDFENIDGMKNWQKKEFGKEIIQILKHVD